VIYRLEEKLNIFQAEVLKVCILFFMWRPTVVKKQEEEEEEPVEEPKKEPLSLEELLSKKQAEEAARSKVRCLKLTLFLCSFSLRCEVFNILYITNN
jgi:hypothetical protein